MLLKLLRSWVGNRGSDTHARKDEFPKERLARLVQAHERAPIDLHLHILYENIRIGQHGLNPLVELCVAGSGAQTPPLKALHRPLASFFLAQYLLHALDIEGAWAECGVFLGTSASLLCRTAQTRIPDYTGTGLHLIDSFAGLSKPSDQDLFPVRGRGKQKAGNRTMPENWLAAPIDHARTALKDFPDVTFNAGWIPEIFTELPDTRWSFVHLDVDLYAPTLDSLAYFFPRLSTGGIIICDDYGAPLFPGAHRALDDFCEEHEIPYVVLDTGQSVIIKA